MSRFDPIRASLAGLNRLASWPVLDRLGLRRRTERAVFTVTRSGFQTVAAASRAFSSDPPRSAASATASPTRPETPLSAEVFDLNPTDDQQALVDVVTTFAAERIRPAASAADRECQTPAEILAAATELGLAQIGIPEQAGGLWAQRNVVTGVLVAQALAHGDLGIAVACLAPAAVSTALSLWGSADQQARYLTPFASGGAPAAALCVLEPRAGFDPFSLHTRAIRRPGGFTISGVKSLVPLAHTAELFVVAAELDGEGPGLFVIESSTAGIRVESEPAMGLRAASLGRLLLDDVAVPADARLAGSAALDPAGSAAQDPADDYRRCIRLGRLAWSALAVGCGQAVLDHVIPYVNQRMAFGEPISHRQAVAFTVADMAIELEGMRLVCYRAASRAELGLDFARETALARQLCAERGMIIGSAGVQLLGGHGFVKEHPVERWYRDLRAIAVMEGALLV